MRIFIKHGERGLGLGGKNNVFFVDFMSTLWFVFWGLGVLIFVQNGSLRVIIKNVLFLPNYDRLVFL